MKKIAIYGAGGFGREVACFIRIINRASPQWDMIGYFDDGKEIGSENEYGKVLGGKNELNLWKDKLAVVVAISEPKTLQKVVAEITNPLVNFPNIIAPDFLVLDEQNFKMGKGNIITLNCSISCNVSMGDFNILNGYNSLGHDVKIGSYNSFMPSVKISGEVVMGDCNFWGTASTVLQQIYVGSNIRVGAGSVIIRKPQDGMLYVGNPAVKMKF